MNKNNLRKNPSPDAVLKDYWGDNSRFADLFNQFFFGGEEVLQAEYLTEQDTEEDMMIQDMDQEILTVSRSRDVVKQYADGMELALVAIENQKKIHYGMPVRTMLYESLEYTRQCKALEREHHRKGDLKTPETFLSGLKRGDRIHPVLTLVVYYEEKEWDGPLALSDMMDVPEKFAPFFNNHAIHLLQMNHAGDYHFKNKDNQDFFHLVDAFYKKRGKIGIKELQQKSAGREIYWETLAAFGAVTNSKRMIKLAYQNEGGNLKMWGLLEDIKEEGRREGIREGQRKGWQRGRQEGRRELNTILQMNQRLLQEERYDDLKRASNDDAFREKLLAELFPKRAGK